MTTLIQDAFKAIGAEAVVETAGNAFEIDVRQNGDREVYQLKYPTGDTVLAECLTSSRSSVTWFWMSQAGDCQLVDGTCAATTNNTGSLLRCLSIFGQRPFAARWRR